MKFKRTLSLLLSAAMLAAAAFSTAGTAKAAEVQSDVSLATLAAEKTGNDYGLADNIQDGVILHCFCWKYNDIKAMLPEIAEAGFTSVQTSPPQATDGTGSWWWFYQPKGFYIGSSALGTKADFEALCSEADNYGIKIVADVVANHLAGNHDNIQEDLKDSQYWHPDIGGSYDGNRYQVTHGTIGMPDLNTEHSYVQQCVKKYIEELKSAGADGIRFDAAKHIGLPSEGDQFWPTVTSVSGLWYYGEILNNPGVSFENNQQEAARIMKEYTQYMTVTDSTYGMTLRNELGGGSAPSGFGYLCTEQIAGIANNKLIYWGESHDNWSNNDDWGYSWWASQNIIDRAYALAASRNEITALYFSRPSTHVKDDITIGAKGSTAFTSPEVAAVNHFHNAMIGQPDYYVAENGNAAVCRSGGAVVVKGSGSGQVTISNGGGTVAPGEYTDEITGNKWTVTSTTISGSVGDSGIAVIYDGTPVNKPSVTISPNGGSFTTDTQSVTLTLKNATSGTYKIGNDAEETFTGTTKTITIGQGVAYGSTITVTATATDGETTSSPVTATFTKRDPSQVTTVYFDNSKAKWSSVYCYVYKGDGSSDTDSGTDTDTGGGGSSGTIYFTDNQHWGSANAYFFNSSGTVGSEWPGTSMSNIGDDGFGNQKFSVSVPSGATTVVFNNGSDQTEDVAIGSNNGFWTDGSRDGDGHLVVTGYVQSSGSKLPVASGAVQENAKWPGVVMEKGADGIYYYVVPDNLVDGSVIFSDGSDGSTAGSQIPAQDEPGMAIGGVSHKWDGSSWVVVSGPHTDTDTDTSTDTDSGTDSDTDTDVPTVTVLLGDANLDDKVTLRDASVALRSAVNVVTLEDKAFLSADVTMDNKVTTTDVLAIMQYDVKIDTSYDIGKRVQREAR